MLHTLFFVTNYLCILIGEFLAVYVTVLHFLKDVINSIIEPLSVFFLSYPPDIKAYKVTNLNTNQMFTSRMLSSMKQPFFMLLHPHFTSLTIFSLSKFCWWYATFIYNTCYISHTLSVSEILHLCLLQIHMNLPLPLLSPYAPFLPTPSAPPPLPARPSRLKQFPENLKILKIL